MNITMKEIADSLDVSIATVSRALSGKADTVSAKTRDAVVALAKQHGYKARKSIGRSVAFLIDQVVFQNSSHFYSRIIAGVEDELNKKDMFFQFKSIDRSLSDPNEINLNFNNLAGILFVGTYHDELLVKLQERNIPIVLIDYQLPLLDFDSVLIDNVGGIIKAAHHLHAFGHRRIALITIEKNVTSSRERMYGYERAVELFNLDYDSRLIRECGGRVDEAHQVMNSIIKEKTPPTAVLTHNDLTAIGVMDAIKQNGFSIPEDISVVGFDDIPLSCEVVPSLTTVHVPKWTIGKVAVERLLIKMKGETECVQKIVLPCELVVRKSTGMRKNRSV